MPYGDDISEGLPFVLSNPSGATYTARSYDYSGLGGKISKRS